MVCFGCYEQMVEVSIVNRLNQVKIAKVCPACGRTVAKESLYCKFKSERLVDFTNESMEAAI